MSTGHRRKCAAAKEVPSEPSRDTRNSRSAIRPTAASLGGIPVRRIATREKRISPGSRPEARTHAELATVTHPGECRASARWCFSAIRASFQRSRARNKRLPFDSWRLHRRAAATDLYIFSSAPEIRTSAKNFTLSSRPFSKYLTTLPSGSQSPLLPSQSTAIVERTFPNRVSCGLIAAASS